jgi:hypothetical protein
MSNDRSPRYPSISLDRAIQSVKALYQKEGKTAVPPAVAVKAWGYGGMSGPARSRIAALRQYGLIDQPMNGPIRASGRALTLILRSPDSREYGAALQEAALSPPLFRELHDGWLEASDDALMHHLVSQRGFSDDGARRVIATFRETLAFARLGDGPYDEDTDPDNGMRDDMGAELLESRPRRPTTGSAAFPSDNPSLGVDQYRYPLYGGAAAEITFRGGRVTPRDVQLLREYLGLLEKTLESDATPSEPKGNHPPQSPATTQPIQNGARPTPLTPEAQELLRKADAGGVPMFTTDNLTRIADENGVSVSSDTTPNEIIEELRRRA